MWRAGAHAYHSSPLGQKSKGNNSAAGHFAGIPDQRCRSGSFIVTAPGPIWPADALNPTGSVVLEELHVSHGQHESCYCRQQEAAFSSSSCTSQALRLVNSLQLWLPSAVLDCFSSALVFVALRYDQA